MSRKDTVTYCKHSATWANNDKHQQAIFLLERFKWEHVNHLVDIFGDLIITGKANSDAWKLVQPGMQLQQYCT